ncbi:MAG: DUF1624 domain-containing protein [Bdellovibrionales bacterium]|nr:DUF1624 domain-containing protein [Bdellovibrionales bacterium]
MSEVKMSISSATATGPGRSTAIDSLRGVSLVLMTLDHGRDFLTLPSYMDHLVPDKMSIGLFFTRWITFFTATILFFLAGLGARLSLSRGKKKEDLHFFLINRGVWLIILDVSVIYFARYFTFEYISLSLGALWAMGISMIFLSLLIFLTDKSIFVISLLVIFGHNTFDAYSSHNFQSFGWLWKLLHERGLLFSIAQHSVKVSYPLIPWIFVMSLGYVFGMIWNKYQYQRIRICTYISLILISLFLILKSVNIYGDPVPWRFQKTWILTCMSFLNIEKYPASLDYILFTLGVTMGLLAFFEGNVKFQWKLLRILGRAPLFYYIVHLYLLHIFALLLAVICFGRLISMDLVHYAPTTYGFPLWLIYSVAGFVIIPMYPLCLWYIKLKQSSNNRILKFL